MVRIKLCPTESHFFKTKLKSVNVNFSADIKLSAEKPLGVCYFDKSFLLNSIEKCFGPKQFCFLPKQVNTLDAALKGKATKWEDV